MAETVKHTPGPFFVTQPEKFPFDIVVVDGEGNEVWSERRYAHSSRQKSVADCMDAVGFDHGERPAIRKLLKVQLADMHVRAAAPDLLEAMRELNDAFNDGLCNSGTPGFDSGRLGRAQAAVEAAIAKAEGRS